MNAISELLFNILKCALWETPVQTELFVALSEKDWQALFKTSAQQGVTAIVYDVVRKLPNEVQPPREIKIRWALSTETIEKRYERQFAGAKSLSDIWNDAGIKTVVIKGLSLSKYYPEPHHRECGDFDCFLLDDRFEDGNVLAEQNGAKVNREWYKHSQIYYRGMMIENHNFLVTTRKGKYAKELNDILADKLNDKLQPIEGTKILLPSAAFTALFVTYHSFAHFICEGVTLRHLCDWACFMRAEQRNFDWDTFYELCKKFKFDRFVDVSNEIISKYLGIDLTGENVICESPYTERVLADILYENAKIYSCGNGKWHNRIKLITNMFSYGWKHRDIARSSNVAYLWTVVSGYIFKREKH